MNDFCIATSNLTPRFLQLTPIPSIIQLLRRRAVSKPAFRANPVSSFSDVRSISYIISRCRQVDAGVSALLSTTTTCMLPCSLCSTLRLHINEYFWVCEISGSQPVRNLPAVIESPSEDTCWSCVEKTCGGLLQFTYSLSSPYRLVLGAKDTCRVITSSAPLSVPRDAQDGYGTSTST